MIAPHLFLSVLSHHGLKGWFIILLLCDLFLALGSRTSVRAMLLPWLILYMIHLVFSCILAPLLILLASTMVKEIRDSDIFEEEHNQTKQSVNRMLPEDRDFIEEFEFMLDSFGDYDWNNMKHSHLRMALSVVILLVLSMLHVYTWIVTRSLYLHLGPAQGQVHRIQQGQVAWIGQGQGQVAWQGQGHGPGHGHGYGHGQAWLGQGQVLQNKQGQSVPWYVTGLQQERKRLQRELDTQDVVQMEVLGGKGGGGMYGKINRY